MCVRRQVGQRQLASGSAGSGTRGSSRHQQVFAPQCARHSKAAPHFGQRVVSVWRLMGGVSREEREGGEGIFPRFLLRHLRGLRAKFFTRKSVPLDECGRVCDCFARLKYAAEVGPPSCGPTRGTQIPGGNRDGAHGVRVNNRRPGHFQDRARQLTSPALGGLCPCCSSARGVVSAGGCWPVRPIRPARRLAPTHPPGGRSCASPGWTTSRRSATSRRSDRKSTRLNSSHRT